MGTGMLSRALRIIYDVSFSGNWQGSWLLAQLLISTGILKVRPQALTRWLEPSFHRADSSLVLGHYEDEGTGDLELL